MERAEEKVVAVMFHNGNVTQEIAFDMYPGMYRNVNFYKVNTVDAHEIKNLFACTGAKPYFKFYKNG